MSNYWVDANILLRFITNDPLNLAERSARFLQKAEQKYSFKKEHFDLATSFGCFHNIVINNPHE